MRNPYDGQPFYCTWCGAEWNTNECASGCCELETEAEAEERAWLHAADAMPVLRPITVEVARLTSSEFGEAGHGKAGHGLAGQGEARQGEE